MFTFPGNPFIQTMAKEFSLSSTLPVRPIPCAYRGREVKEREKGRGLRRRRREEDEERRGEGRRKVEWIREERGGEERGGEETGERGDREERRRERREERRREERRGEEMRGGMPWIKKQAELPTHITIVKPPPFFSVTFIGLLAKIYF
jgi:hypothetical protein